MLKKSSAYLLAALALAAVAPPVSGFAQTAPASSNAGAFAVRVGIAGIIPEDNSSHIDKIGGSVSADSSVMPEVDLSYFLTDNLSLQLIATSTRHEVEADNTALKKIDLGSAYVLPPAIVLQYHFLTHEAVSFYAGAGLDVAWFYDINPNGTKLASGAPLINKLSFSPMVGPVLNAGTDIHLCGNWYANFDVKQVFATTDARVHTALGFVKARDSLDPLVVSTGISYRF
jgi:outer membrane protein